MSYSNNKGFTLVELLVVIAIVGLLSTLAVVGLNIARNKGKIAKAQHDIQQIYNAASALVNDTNEWPGHQPPGIICSNLPGGCPANNEICGQDAAANTCNSQLSDATSGLTANDGSFGGWNGPYMTTVPVDAWGREYFFVTDYLIDIDNRPCLCSNTGCHPAVVVGSYGPDGLGVPSANFTCDDIIYVIL